ncbi:aldo keto reductase [Trichuris trichiura]|uniref:Aldo keto reductase n=1 Tax=Trichuris trichiura TaxID=36087 RepID=A0A077Z4V1_TRITR|nr:aldo keto reductase [Trichuris trichiura]
MPMIGYGTYTIGYRHIDTAYIYNNEDIVGEVLSNWLASGRIKREELFVTTKLPGFSHRKADVEPSLLESLRSLKLDYIDLYLIHSPMGMKRGTGEVYAKVDDQVIVDVVDHMETWKAMEEIYKKGLARSIGLSNFNLLQLERVVSNCSIKPHNLQSECHLYWPQNELLTFCRKHNISFTAYGPLGAPYRQKSNANDSACMPLQDPTVLSIASKLGKSPAQVLLKWLLQRGIAVIPRSTKENRIRENFELSDFTLDDADMAALSNVSVRRQLFLYTWALNHPDHPNTTLVQYF